MVEEIDKYRSANLLIKRHGDEAAIFAAMQADACLEKGDLDGTPSQRSRATVRIGKAALAGV